MKTGYLVNSKLESLELQFKLFGKGYEWGRGLRDVMHPKLLADIEIGKYGTVILFGVSNTLTYAVLDTNMELEYFLARGISRKRKNKLSI
jgi:hypothetical protein